MPKLEEIDVVLPSQPEEEATIVDASNNGSTRPGCGEPWPSWTARDTSPVDGERGKMPI